MQPEPEEGITIVLRFKDIKESRKFGKKAMFQVQLTNKLFPNEI